MRSILLATIAGILLSTLNSFAQAKKPVSAPKRPKSAVAAPRGYNFRVQINADKSMRLEVLTGYEYTNVSNRLLAQALSEYLSLQSGPPGRKPVGPRVLVHPDASLDFKTIVDVLQTARASDPAEVILVTPEGLLLKIPPEPKLENNVDVKPNPLTLIANLDNGGNITLNNEESGTLSDPAKLIEKLRDIFHQREQNGVFREGTNEVEKTVFIKIPLSAQFTDLINLAKALDDAGADSIGLQIDDLAPSVDARKKILTN